MASEQVSNELEPCPFCGGDGDFCETSVWWVRCDVCGADAEHHETVDGAVSNWNRRAPSAREAKLVEALKPFVRGRIDMSGTAVIVGMLARDAQDQARSVLATIPTDGEI